MSVTTKSTLLRLRMLPLNSLFVTFLCACPDSSWYVLLMKKSMKNRLLKMWCGSALVSQKLYPSLKSMSRTKKKTFLVHPLLEWRRTTWDLLWNSPLHHVILPLTVTSTSIFGIPSFMMFGDLVYHFSSRFSISKTITSLLEGADAFLRKCNQMPLN